MFYLVFIIAATFVVAVVNYLADGVMTLEAFALQMLFASVGTLSAFIIDGILAFIVRRLPNRWFSPDVKLFSVKEKERNFYRRLKIGAWKDYVPELGGFTGFHKNKLETSSDARYLARFLMESNYGVLGHIAGAIFGFAILFIPYVGRPSIALPIAIINAILSILPTMILRYHTPPLQRLYRRALKKEERA